MTGRRNFVSDSCVSLFSFCKGDVNEGAFSFYLLKYAVVVDMNNKNALYCKLLRGAALLPAI